MPPTFPATLVLYAVASTLYLSRILVNAGAPEPAGGGARLTRLARVALVLAFLAHIADIGWLCAHGQHPVVNAREAVYFAAWLICGVYLTASLRSQLPVLGALVAPTVLVLDIAARLVPSTEVAHPASTLRTVHIALATTGVALFAVAAGAAVVYILAERRLKAHKRSAGILAGGMALSTLDRLSQRCIAVGFPVFTVAMITGAWWAVHDPLLGVFTVQYAVAALAWLLYGALIVMRIVAGWRGRRAALLTLAGFGSTMAVLAFYFLRGAKGV